METIHISEVNSVGIISEAKAAGLNIVQLLGEFEHPDHPGSGDWSIRLYDVGGVRVADTNGDPVWEEDDRSAFEELLEEYSVLLTEARRES